MRRSSGRACRRCISTGSFWPHTAGFNKLNVESPIPDAVFKDLQSRGHDVTKIRPHSIAGCATAVLIDPASRQSHRRRRSAPRLLRDGVLTSDGDGQVAFGSWRKNPVWSLHPTAQACAVGAPVWSCLFAALALTATVSAHDIPNDVIVQAFLKPEGNRARLLLRVPMKAND